MTPFLLILLAALQLADGYTTLRILAKGGTELNPLMAKAFERFGVTRTLIVKAIGVTAIGYFLGTQSIELLGALCGFYVVVVIHNIRAMQK